ncbi:MAG: hypothetical protein IJ736_02170 [Firmicutes bacterium]|nr:hypothetical protein [Bacillota bacterium]
MQEIDRDFLYYGILNYKWVNEDESFCIVIKNGSIEFKTPEGGEHKTYYRIGADKRSCAAEMGSFAQSMMGMGEIFEKCHEGELFRLNCSDKYIGDNEGKKIYKIDRIWYGNGRLHGDFTEIEREKKIYIDFDYEGEKKVNNTAKNDENSWDCFWCGEKNSGKFCTNCGKEKKPWQ